MIEARRFANGIACVGVLVSWDRFIGVTLALGFFSVRIGVRRNYEDRAPIARRVACVSVGCGHGPADHVAHREKDKPSWKCREGCGCTSFMPRVLS